MLIDALNVLDMNTSLTPAVAGTPYPSANVIDLSVSRDIGPGNVPISAIFTSLPASATAGATINAALQTSADGVTWNTIEETGPQAISQYTATNYWLFRGTVPAGVLRYLRMAYTASATLTGGVVTTQIGGEWPRTKTYPKNYAS